MKTKSLTWIMILVFAYLITGLKIQASLNVLEKSGTQSSFILRNIKRIVFTAGSMTVNKGDGNNRDVGMADILNLNLPALCHRKNIRKIPKT